jgi:NADPH-dependent curcumin reductase CurA
VCGVTIRNRQWLLAARPTKSLRPADFAYCEQPFTVPQLEAGQVLVRNLVFSCAPTIRNWMNAGQRSYRTSIALGEPIVGPACAQVVSSAHSRFAPGTRLIGVSRWEDYTVIEPDTAFAPVLDVPSAITSTDALGLYGLNSLTAYFGLLRIGRLQAGETVVVSAAAGAVGSMVVQIARLKGCRVVGIAGGRDKCAWLTDVCGVHAAIDYTTDDLDAALTQSAPGGVDVFFDNVGGQVLQVTTEHMAVHGRIVLCGQVSAYDGDAPAPGPRDMMRVVYQRLLLQGFVLGDFLNELQAARAQLMRWRAQGKIAAHQDVRYGFERLPGAFLDLFAGANNGALLVEADNICLTPDRSVDSVGVNAILC